MRKQYTHSSPAGFTLIEMLVAMAIMLIVGGLILANYYRGRDDSILSREAALLMARIRLSQSYAAAGKTSRYCYHLTGSACLVSADCPNFASNPCLPYLCTTPEGKDCVSNNDCASGATCQPTVPGASVPSGGYAITLSCLPAKGSGSSLTFNPTAYNTSDYDYYLFRQGLTKYYFVQERQNCGVGGNICFPPTHPAFADTAPPPSDGIVHLFSWLTAPNNGNKGDTLVETYTVNSGVQIKDLQITAARTIAGVGKSAFHCGDQSPWQNGHNVPPTYNYSIGYGADGSRYPIQLNIRFLPPSGRQLSINDNINQYPPDNSGGITPLPDKTNPWVQADILLGLTKRTTSCKRVTVTASGVVSQTNDVDCNITTPQ